MVSNKAPSFFVFQTHKGTVLSGAGQVTRVINCAGRQVPNHWESWPQNRSHPMVHDPCDHPSSGAMEFHMVIMGPMEFHCEVHRCGLPDLLLGGCREPGWEQSWVQRGVASAWQRGRSSWINAMWCREGLSHGQRVTRRLDPPLCSESASFHG